MITKEDLIKLKISYDPETGKISGRKETFDGRYFGISIYGRRYYSHRIAFLYMRGYFPAVVDHDDDNKKNNKWINLIETNQYGNKSKYAKNIYKETKNYKNKTYEYWFAKIVIGGNYYFSEWKKSEKEAEIELIKLMKKLEIEQ